MSVRLIFFLQFYARNKPHYDYFIYLFFVEYGAVAILSVLSMAVWHSQHDYTRTEYVLVNVDDRAFGAEPPARAAVCPERKAGVLSRLTFSWLNPLLTRGYKEPLDDNDVWRLDRPDTSAEVEARFNAHWAKEVASGAPSLFRALRRTFFWQSCLGLFWKIFNDASQFVGQCSLGLLRVRVGRPPHREVTHGLLRPPFEEGGREGGRAGERAAHQ